MTKILAVILSLCFAEAFSLSLSVYYESLCPDSVNFLVNQLDPAYAIIKNDVHIQYVPWGNAHSENSSGSVLFTCQHGPNECHGNLVQACVIAYNQLQDVQTDFITCAMGSEDPSDDTLLQQCAESSKVSWKKIKTCIGSKEGVNLMLQNERLTNEVDPKISWVPALVFDGVYNQTLQDEGEKDLLGTVCELLGDNKPTGCPSKLEEYSVILQ